MRSVAAFGFDGRHCVGSKMDGGNTSSSGAMTGDGIFILIVDLGWVRAPSFWMAGAVYEEKVSALMEVFADLG